MSLRLNVFGDFGAMNDDGQRYELGSSRQQALLGYLALTARHEASRSRIAGMIWPDAGESEARHSLRQCLSVLRKALGSEAETLAVTADRVALEPGRFEVDADRFHKLAASSNPVDWQAASDLISGEPMAGTDLGGTPFDEWLADRRRAISQIAITTFARLADWQSQNGDVYGAIATTRRIIELDPFDEAARRRLMQLFIRDARSSAAIREFRDFAILLREQLAVDPAQETTRLYEHILATLSGTQSGDEITLESYACALEQLPDSVIVTDLEARIVGFSPVAEQSFGVRKADVLGKTPTILHSDSKSHDLPLLMVQRALEHGRWTEVVQLRTGHGGARSMRRSVVTLRTPSGRAIGAFGMTLN